MIELPQITLVAMGSTSIEGNLKALEYSAKDIKFGAVKFVTSAVSYAKHRAASFIEVLETDPISSVDIWNYNIVYNLGDYVDTEYCILTHPDGYVVHPESWKDEFLQYDFIGAPWPLPQDNYSYLTPSGELVRVGNSVSLRSKKLLDLPKKLDLPWGICYGNTNEDGFLCVHNRGILKENGVNFAPIEVAKWFSREHDIPENADVEKPFCFHRTWQRNKIYQDFEEIQTR